ncbi:antibiotic biosynthesis monooxygenase [Metabacillus sp. GX 13764]|uniref:putative quinol monooxygenase n=1 Tax=Metabacillus kandeliae TaxID=2900151 RepID=UPI001E5A12CE|nr:putative quinol monooxygenase [Metabacillus kandeliae]MCD7035384.1 antibiotic biosynthesis monooxygenase [Metabacillus kandeliae]
MIIIHALFQVNPEKQEEFLQEIQPLVAASREESGNISYDLVKDTDKENVFRMIEVWQDGPAVQSHNQSEHFTAFTGKAKAFLAAPLEAKIYEAQTMGM